MPNKSQVETIKYYFRKGHARQKPVQPHYLSQVCTDPANLTADTRQPAIYSNTAVLSFIMQHYIV